MGVVLVLGGASCVWQDADAAFELFAPSAVYACNDIGARWPGPVDVWATLHPEFLERWIMQRARRGHPPAGQIASAPMIDKRARLYLDGVNREHAPAYARVDRISDFKFERQHNTLTSGLFAAKLAIEDGFAAVLAGVPMSAQEGHFLREGAWTDQTGPLGLRDALPYLQDNVRSMSGATRARLGKPTRDWLESFHEKGASGRTDLSPSGPVVDRGREAGLRVHTKLHRRARAERYGFGRRSADARNG